LQVAFCILQLNIRRNNMATEDPKVSGQPGEVELPTPQFSEEGVSSTSTDVDVIVNKVVERLAPTLDETVERKAKSLQDKRFSKIEKKLGIRSDVLAELAEEGVTIPEDVRTRMEIRELRERLDQPPTQPAPVRDDGSSQLKAATTEAIAELKSNGLTTDDPVVIDLFRGQYRNRAEFDLAIQKYINQKLRPPKPANPADVVQPPVKNAAVGEKSLAQLEADYQKDLLAISQTKRGDEKLRAIAELKAKAREAGLNKA
jgi:hypothetical protein